MYDIDIAGLQKPVEYTLESFSDMTEQENRPFSL